MGTANHPLTFLPSHSSCEFRSTCAMHCGRCRSKSLGLYVICTATTTARPSHSSPFVSQFTADVAFPLSQSIWGRRCWTTQNWHSDVGEWWGRRAADFVTAVFSVQELGVCWTGLVFQGDPSCTMHEWHPTQFLCWDFSWTPGCPSLIKSVMDSRGSTFASQDFSHGSYLLIQCGFSLCHWICPLLDLYGRLTLCSHGWAIDSHRL